MENNHSFHIIHEPLFSFAWERAKNVNLILFSEDGKQILAVKKNGALDILRGSREWDDDSLEDTVRREANEQASAMLDAVTICAILSTTEELLSEVSYELVMTAFVTNKGPRHVWQETESEFINKEIFLTRYAHDEREKIETLVGMAEDFRVRRSTHKYNTKTFQTKYLQTA